MSNCCEFEESNRGLDREDTYLLFKTLVLLSRVVADISCLSPQGEALTLHATIIEEYAEANYAPYPPPAKKTHPE